MNKLTVGVILKSDYNAHAGGGFTYYGSLVEAIDNYKFDPSLQFKFISFDSVSPEGFKKDVIRINVADGFSERDKMICRIGNLTNKRLFSHLFNIRSRFQAKVAAVREKNYIKQLIASDIDILYPIVPFSQFLNFPCIETHWDIGHYSMYPFPEVTMNGTFEFRENYYNYWLHKSFGIFCESVSGKNELIKYKNINTDRIFVVPMFAGKISQLDVSEVERKLILESYGVTSGEFFFYPAQFWSHKNHYGLLHAFNRLSTEFPNFKLVLSGSDKGNLNYIKSVITSLALTEHVIITGFVSNEAIYTFYKESIALVMPTYLGPTNLPLLEAQAIGCPVICSDFEGHHEMLSAGNNMFVQPDDFEGLYLAMKEIYLRKSTRFPIFNETFNLTTAITSVENAFLAISKKRRTFGFNFKQY